ncbi:MAG: sigma factor-like helix-turn-helix DNA-binding protein [Nitriliruptoraceae bacterium]
MPPSSTNGTSSPRGNRRGAAGRGDGRKPPAAGGAGTQRGQRDGRARSDRGNYGVDETVQQLAGPLQRVLRRLPETQRKVLELRMGLVDGHPHDLADTARALGLSMAEARDIEKRAFAYIHEAIPVQQLQRFLQR